MYFIALAIDERVMFKDKIFTWLLPRLISKQCNNMVRRTGEGARSVNCFSIYLGNSDGELRYLVSDYNADKRELKILGINEKDVFANEDAITIADAMKHNIVVYHYYGISDFCYENLYDLLFNRITRYNEFRAICVRFFWVFSQGRFNKKELVTKKTIELLRFLIDNQFKVRDQNTNSFSESRYGIDLHSLMTELYGIKWVNHPNSIAQRETVKFYLDSLIDSKDMEESGGKYFITKKALQTSERYEEDERRHLDNIGAQNKMFYATCVMALLAAIQAMPYIMQLLNCIAKLM